MKKVFIAILIAISPFNINAKEYIRLASYTDKCNHCGFNAHTDDKTKLLTDFTIYKKSDCDVITYHIDFKDSIMVVMMYKLIKLGIAEFEDVQTEALSENENFIKESLNDFYELEKIVRIQFRKYLKGEK